MTSRKKAATATMPVPANGTAIVPVPAMVVVNEGIEPDPRNPHSLLVLTGDAPGTSGLRLMHGTLRCVHRGHRNSSEAFAAAKLAVADSSDPFAVTALRHEVVAPIGADDLYADAWLFGRLIDHAVGHGAGDAAALLAYVTITEPEGRLHETWRRARTMTEQLVDRYRVPALLVQHDPARKQRATRPHIHLLLAVRTLGLRGYEAPVTALIGDKARDLFATAWAATG